MDKKKGKVVRFPRLKERLLERGYEELQAKRYKEALPLLNEAQEIDPNDSEVELGIIICLFELGKLDEAKERCYRMLQKGRGDYFQLLQIYLSILIHLQQYEEVTTTIHAVLEESDLSVPLRQQLVNLLHFSEKVKQKRPSLNEHDKELIKLVRPLHEATEVSEQIAVIKQLEKEDITPVLTVLRKYLAEAKNNPMVKTMVLCLLTSKRVSERVLIEKFGDTLTIIPAELDENIQLSFAKEVLGLLEVRIAGKNPSLYNIAENIWLRYLYVLYPFVPKKHMPEEWAAALHWMACSFQGMEMNEREIERLYNVSFQEIASLCKKLYEVEEISYF